MNNNNEFELDFDDDVIDMTDPNRNTTNTTYGTYNGDMADNDIYGVYQPGAAYRRQQAEGYLQTGDSSTGMKILNVLYYIALFSQVALLAYFVLAKNYDFSFYMRTEGLLGVFVEIIVIVDAITMYNRYKKISLILTCFLFPLAYPFVRNSARSEGKGISALWLVAFIVVFVMFVKDVALPMVLSTKGTDLYSSEYEATMKKFKDYKYDGKTRTEDVLRLWFSEYSLEVSNEDSEYLYVRAKGQTDTQIQGAVTTDSKINPNTIWEFKVNRTDGSYTVLSLKLNDTMYNQYRDSLWEYWFTNYVKPSIG